MQENAKTCSQALLWLPPNQVLPHADACTEEFYRSYNNINKSEVMKIPRCDPERRKKFMNNITGRACKLKKDWQVAVYKCLLEGLIERISSAVDSFEAAPGAQGTAIASRVAEFRAAAAARAASGATVHEAIDESARREGERAGKNVYERKLAEAALASLTLETPSPVIAPIEHSLTWAQVVDAAIESRGDQSSPGPLSPSQGRVRSRGKKNVTRSIKNNVAATITNHKRRSLVAIYRQQVQEHVNLLADIQEATATLNNTPSPWVDDAWVSTSRGAA